jgi:REP element-mobilizing transposase RayT
MSRHPPSSGVPSALSMEDARRVAWRGRRPGTLQAARDRALSSRAASFSPLFRKIFERNSNDYFQTMCHERKAIYRDTRDRRHFLEVLAERVARFRVRLRGFVLMDPHYHLMLDLSEANRSRAVQWLNGSESLWFNRRHGRSGRRLKQWLQRWRTSRDGSRRIFGTSMAIRDGLWRCIWGGVRVGKGTSTCLNCGVIDHQLQIGGQHDRIPHQWILQNAKQLRMQRMRGRSHIHLGKAQSIESSQVP